MAKLLLGKEVNASINEEIKAKVEKLKAQDITPALGIIRIGEREDDIAYEKSAAKRCETLGVAYEKFLLPADVKEEEVLKTISQVNKNDKIHGVLLFRPLPKHLNADRIVNALAVEKDVDGITDLSMAGVFMGKDMGYAPCTPSACMKVLEHYGIDCTGKKVVVIGRSLVVGKPAAMMLLKKNATVTVCHTRTVDMPSVVKEADIVVVAAGKAGVIDGNYLREGQIVIDVGINVNEEGKLNGLPLNRALRDEDNDIYDIVAGNFLIVGLGKSEFTSLTPALMKKYEKLFHHPEAFIKLGERLTVVPMPEPQAHKSTKERGTAR